MVKYECWKCGRINEYNYERKPEVTFTGSQQKKIDKKKIRIVDSCHNCGTQNIIVIEA